VNTPVRIGMDTSKSIFQLHGVDENEAAVVRRQFRRAEMIRYFEKLPPTLVAIESCGSSHHWARLLQSFGHEVKLIAPQYVKPYVKRGKNDAADAEALCEAVTRPTMRFVPVKSRDRQAACMLMTVRERLVGVKSQLSNAFRSYAAEFGIVGPSGRQNVNALIKRVLEDDALPELGSRAVPVPGEGIRRGRGAAGGDRRQADEVASLRRAQPAHRDDPWRRPDRLHNDEHEGSAGGHIQVRPPVCGLAWADAQRSLYRWPATPRRDHEGRGSFDTVDANRRRNCTSQAHPQRQHQAVALARRDHAAEAAQARGGRTRQ
jgi:hypothetical protein